MCPGECVRIQGQLAAWDTGHGRGRAALSWMCAHTGVGDGVVSPGQGSHRQEASAGEGGRALSPTLWLWKGEVCIRLALSLSHWGVAQGAGFFIRPR